MKVTLTEFVTLDGVCQGPGSVDEDRTDGFERGGWFTPYIDEQFMRRASEWLDLADGLLLGRRTYEAFARDWPQMDSPDDPFSARMNGLPKYVASRTLTSGDWNPTTVLRGEAVDTVAALKKEPGRELQIHGSARLGNALIAAGVVDVVRLVVAPTILGNGRRLLTHPGPATGLRLVSQEATGSGLMLLEYELVGDAPVAEFVGEYG